MDRSNREALIAHLEAGARGAGERGSLIVLRLRKIASIAETAGPEAARHVVATAAERLAELAARGEFLADLGEGTFALVTAGAEAAAEARAERLIAGVSREVAFGERRLLASANAGVCPLGDTPLAPAEQLERAMGALQHAMSRGPGVLEVVSEARAKRVFERWEMARALEEASPRGEFRLEYQPIYTPSGSVVAKAEALLRWDSPAMGRVGPDRFIPLLEESGLIRPVGEWVLHEACTRVRAWREQSGQPVRVAVNLSPVQMVASSFEAAARRVLAQTGCEAAWIELEVTEGAIVRDFEGVRAHLDALAALGFTLAIDDFGAGYSSLGQLAELPVQQLKMDRSLLAGVPDGGKRSGVARAVVALAEALGVGVTAEGVESAEQAAWLEGFPGMRCQGYHFSRPLRPEHLPAPFAGP